MIRFIHTADIHYGMENYGKTDPQTGIHTRLLDFDRAFNFCVDYAIEQNVDFFLFAGDAYKTTNPSPTQQRLLIKRLLKLQQANIPILLVIGNHDNPLTFGKANSLDILQEFPVSGFHVIAKPSSFMLQTKSGPIQIVGIPWPTKNNIAINDNHIFKTSFELTEYMSNATATIIQHFAQALDHTIPAVLVGHLTVSSGIFSGSEKRAIYGNDPVLLPSQLAIAPFDYIALGHLHRHQNLNENGYPPLVYAGSIERIDFGERKEDKGFCDVTIKNKGNTQYNFIKTPTRPFIQIDVKLSTGIDQTAHIIDEIKKYEIDNAILKIIYHLPAGCTDTVNIGTIQRACQSALDIVGIIPHHEPMIREKRNLVASEMDFDCLINSYIDQKPELAKKKETLMQKIYTLKNELIKQEL